MCVKSDFLKVILLFFLLGFCFSPTLGSICPSLKEIQKNRTLTEAELITELTLPCRYDKDARPKSSAPVFVQIDVNHLEENQQIQFTAFMTVQYRYNDPRLQFRSLFPSLHRLYGEAAAQKLIWVPHLIINNGKDSNRLGIEKDDLFVTISPEGDVTYTQRISTNFYCWMNLAKFPFDSQACQLTWRSWTANHSQMMLHWEEDLPVRISNDLHLTEFRLDRTKTYERIISGPFATGPLAGNYSELVFEYHLRRESGYYMLCYYLPSILLVCTSWVTFWLQADATPPRATLGSSTIIAFITLNAGLVSGLPKISYIKASDVWFLACTIFIFGSLVEFAFVNVIWRRKKKVELMKADSVHILTGAFSPRKARQQVHKFVSMNSLYKIESESQEQLPSYTNQVNKHDCEMGQGDGVQEQQWHTMSPQEVSIWIDRKSRVVFPVMFLIFNIFYWSFVCLL